MIRINLLAEGRKPVVARRVKPKVAFGDVDPSVLFLAAGLLIGTLVGGGWWWMVFSKKNELEEQIRSAERQVQELLPIIQEVEAFKRKKAELKRRIDVINDLKRRQKGPVKIMDQISRALPDLLWLERMTVQTNTVTINGQAFNTNAVATFLENINQVQEFKEPILRDLPANPKFATYSFSLNFEFSQIIPPEEADGADDEGGGEAAAAM